MNDYFFFLGRNADLSLQEIISYFESRGILGKYYLERNIALFSIEETVDPQKVMESLGGTIKMGKAEIVERGQNEFFKKIEKSGLYNGTENKLKFTVDFYPKDADLFSKTKEIIDNYFKTEGIKAFYRLIEESPSGSMKFDLEFFAIKFGKNYYFGRINAVYDTKNVEFRDMHKPFRRSELAISPRLAKILINMSGATENSLLLDPFCGVGTILQEAMLQGINVIGVDVDDGAIENCKRNIAWIIKNYQPKSGVQIFASNAIDIPKILKSKVDAVASEPFLIPLITYTPKDAEARKMITKAKYTYMTTLNEIKKVLNDGGKIALSLPVMKARESKVRLNIDEICYETGLKLVAGPFPESREDQRVSREIVILEK